MAKTRKYIHHSELLKRKREAQENILKQMVKITRSLNDTIKAVARCSEKLTRLSENINSLNDKEQPSKMEPAVDDDAEPKPKEG